MGDKNIKLIDRIMCICLWCFLSASYDANRYLEVNIIVARVDNSTVLSVNVVGGDLFG